MKNRRYYVSLSHAQIPISNLTLTPSSIKDGTSQEDPSTGTTETIISSSFSPNLKETEEERVERVQKLLRHVMRLKLKIPCCKVYYVEGWGWL